MLRRLPMFALAALLGCAGASPDDAEAPRPVTPEMLKPLTEAYRDYVGLLNQLDSPSPKDRADAMTKLQATPYAYFPDDRDLIAKAAGRDEAARRELIRRGRILDALFAFWGKVDLPKWNDARERIVALGQDARIILVNTLFRMLLNGQLQEQWPQIRFQLIAVGPDTFETAIALFRAKAEQTPDAIIFRKDDLVQVALVILGFGERARPVIEEHAKSPRFNVRRAVVVALGEGRATEHLGVLEHLLKNDPEWMVRADAATALGSIRDRARAGAALVAALKVERDRNVRRHIAESLGTLVYAEGVPTLVASLQVSDFEYGERAMFALFQITGERHLTADAWQKWFDKDYEKWKAKARPVR